MALLKLLASAALCILFLSFHTGGIHAACGTDTYLDWADLTGPSNHPNGIYDDMTDGLCNADSTDDYDWRVCYSDYDSTGYLAMAIHGGKIEYQTSELIADIANGQMTQYHFQGALSSGNYGLHICSQHFDEPHLETMLDLASIEVAISAHGCTCGGHNKRRVCVGGKTAGLRGAVISALDSSYNNVEILDGTTSNKCSGLGGTNLDNPVNEVVYGLQLELSQGLRDIWKTDATERAAFATVVRDAVFDWVASQSQSP